MIFKLRARMNSGGSGELRGQSAYLNRTHSATCLRGILNIHMGDENSLFLTGFLYSYSYDGTPFLWAQPGLPRKLKLFPST